VAMFSPGLHDLSPENTIWFHPMAERRPPPIPLRYATPPLPPQDPGPHYIAHLEAQINQVTRRVIVMVVTMAGLLFLCAIYSWFRGNDSSWMDALAILAFVGFICLVLPLRFTLGRLSKLMRELDKAR